MIEFNLIKKSKFSKENEQRMQSARYMQQQAKEFGQKVLGKNTYQGKMFGFGPSTMLTPDNLPDYQPKILKGTKK